MRALRKEEDNPGRLNKRVELMEQDSIDNQVGGRKTKSITWKPYAKAWASIEHVKGLSRFRLNQQQSELTHVITIRYRNDITRKNRVRYKNRTFKIDYMVNEKEQNRFLVLHVTEDL